MTSATLADALAGFAVDISADTVPAAVREQAALCILDTLGCIVAGVETEEARAFARAEREIAGDGSETPPIGIARALGYFGDVFELNDLVGGHASIGVVAAVLARTLHTRATGDAMIDAVVAGNEVTSRLFESEAWHQKAFDDSAIVVTSILSAFGTAAALARLEGFDRERTREAMTIAGSLACWGPAEVIFGDGGTIKPSLFGAAPADSAFKAVAYARAGLTGPRRLVESELGVMRAIAHEFEPAVVEGDGTWHLLGTQRKLHASCGFTHASLDAIATLVREGVDVAGAERVELHVPPYIIPAVAKDRLPVSPNDARFHLQFLAALAARGADPILPRHSVGFAERLREPGVVETMGRMAVVPLSEGLEVEGQRYNVSRVRVTDGSGRVTAEASCDAPRGASGNPMRSAQVVEKFRVLVGGVLGEELTEACVAEALSLAGAPAAPAIRAAVALALETAEHGGT